MTVEDRSVRRLTPQEIGLLDSKGERAEKDILAPLILTGTIRRSDLFDGTKPKTPLEQERS